MAARYSGSFLRALRYNGAPRRSILEHAIRNILFIKIIFALAHTMLKALYAIRTIDVRGGSIPNSTNGLAPSLLGRLYQGESNETCDSDHQAFQVG
jgi:hypothetical protein